MEDDIFKRILQDKQFHLQLKSEQKEIIQNVLERKDSMAVLLCIMGDDLHINKQIFLLPIIGTC
jgi:hypothetical protein